MDRRIRELERRAAAGDLAAIEGLHHNWARMQLIPSESDLLQMRCGFAIGGEGALPAVISVWKHLLSLLIKQADSEWRYRAAVEGEEYPAMFFNIIEEIEALLHTAAEGLRRLQPIVEEELVHEREGTGLLLSKLRKAFMMILGSPQEGLNYHLDMNRELPPVYLIYNEITESLHIAYLDPREDHWASLAQTERRSPIKLYTIIRKIRGEWQVTLSWNVGDLFDKDTAKYVDPTSLDKMCLPVFNNLPCLLQEAPGIWQEWGYGDCNLDTRKYGNWDYDPIVGELGSMHWLKD